MRLFWNKPSGNAITAHALDNGSDFSCVWRVSFHTILMQLHSNTPGLFSPKHSNNLKSKSTFWNLSIPDCSIVACRVLVGARTIRERESGGRLQALWSVDCSVPLYLASSHPSFWSSKENQLFWCRSSWGKRSSIPERESRGRLQALWTAVRRWGGPKSKDILSVTSFH